MISSLVWAGQGILGWVLSFRSGRSDPGVHHNNDRNIVNNNKSWRTRTFCTSNAG